MVGLQSERVLQQLGSIEMAESELTSLESKYEHAAFRLKRRATLYRAERIREFRLDSPHIA